MLSKQVFKRTEVVSYYNLQPKKYFFESSFFILQNRYAEESNKIEMICFRKKAPFSTIISKFVSEKNTQHNSYV